MFNEIVKCSLVALLAQPCWSHWPPSQDPYATDHYHNHLHQHHAHLVWPVVRGSSGGTTVKPSDRTVIKFSANFSSTLIGMANTAQPPIALASGSNTGNNLIVDLHVLPQQSSLTTVVTLGVTHSFSAPEMFDLDVMLQLRSYRAVVHSISIGTRKLYIS